MFKTILSEKDIKKISSQSLKEKAKREKFESHIEIYIKDNEKYFTYAVLFPRLPFKGFKKWSIEYRVFDSDLVIEKEGAYTIRWPGPIFEKYRDFKKFLKSGVIRKPTDSEMAKLKMDDRFNGIFKVTDVENIEPLSEKDKVEMELELSNVIF